MSISNNNRTQDSEILDMGSLNSQTINLFVFSALHFRSSVLA